MKTVTLWIVSCLGIFTAFSKAQAHDAGTGLLFAPKPIFPIGAEVASRV
ncbi:MAG: hypothetical protein H6Q04_3385, partial [Acidobacteria bacterium]|nr:hypothetical protein [Acidobacteriota bacterium]